MNNKDSYYVFNDKDHEIVFNRHDMPAPWMNYLSNGTLFTMMSQAGGNLTWYKSPEIWRIGRYGFYNLPTDGNGMFVYIKDTKTGKIWNPSFIPAETELDSWHSAHGLGYTRFFAQKDGVTINLKCYIGKDNVLVYNITAKADDDRKIMVYCAQEIGMMEYLREVMWQCYCKNHCNVLFDEQNGALNYEYFADGQPRQDETPFVAFTTDGEVLSFDGDRAEFTGDYRSFRNPVGVENDTLSNTELRGGEGVLALQSQLELKANVEQTVSFYLATYNTQDEYNEFIGKVKGGGYADYLFDTVKEYWAKRNSFIAEVPDKQVERMVNTWNPLQVWVNFNVCREITYYATGTIRGIGVRDAAQDIMANVACNLDDSKEKLKLLMTQQYNSGITNHYFYPIEKKEPITGDRSDNHLWFVYTAYQIIKEEGKTDFLFETVPFFDGGEGTVLEHLERSIACTLNNIGEDGLPLMLVSDWNDMLCNICKEGKGESVMVGQMLVLACKEMSEIYSLLGKDGKEFDKTAKWQTEVINNFAWDGEWYIRAVTDYGMKLGRKTDECGNIWINSQTWAVFSGVADSQKGNMAMESMLKYLDCGYGLLSVYPPLKRNYPTPEREITFAQPGIGENGGVFCHANTWAIIALCMLGRNEDAYKVYTQMIPDNVVEKFGVKVYKSEPYIYSSNIRSPIAMSSGTAGVSWLTGTASWMMIAVTEYMFGIKPTFEGLKLNPCITNSWDKVTIKRMFRGTLYNITIDNTAKCGNHVKTIYLDGKEISGDTVLSNNDTAEVLIVMG